MSGKDILLSGFYVWISIDLVLASYFFAGTILIEGIFSSVII